MEEEGVRGCWVVRERFAEKRTCEQRSEGQDDRHQNTGNKSFSDGVIRQSCIKNCSKTQGRPMWLKM